MNSSSQAVALLACCRRQQQEAKVQSLWKIRTHSWCSKFVSLSQHLCCSCFGGWDSLIVPLQSPLHGEALSPLPNALLNREATFPCVTLRILRLSAGGSQFCSAIGAPVNSPSTNLAMSQSSESMLHCLQKSGGNVTTYPPPH